MTTASSEKGGPPLSTKLLDTNFKIHSTTTSMDALQTTIQAEPGVDGAPSFIADQNSNADNITENEYYGE